MYHAPVLIISNPFFPQHVMFSSSEFAKHDMSESIIYWIESFYFFSWPLESWMVKIFLLVTVITYK
jgi:hypothetical protein